MTEKDVRKDYDPMKANTTAAAVVVSLLIALAGLLVFGIVETAVHL